MREWSVNGRSDGWTTEQLRILGVRSMHRGWMKTLIGSTITDDMRARFEAAKGQSKRSERHAITVWLRMARRRLNYPAASKTAITQRIRDEYKAETLPEAKDDVLKWYADRVRGTPAPPRSKKVRRAEYRKTDEFLSSPEWRRLRMVVIKKRGRRCECCGASPSDGVTVINVDHVKPRAKFPELALEESNLQVLCAACNHGKGNWDQTDWRDRQDPPPVTEKPAIDPPLWWPKLVKKGGSNG